MFIVRDFDAEGKNEFCSKSPIAGKQPRHRENGRGCSRRSGDNYLPPVEAMPSTNCFWKMRYKTTMGSMASREPAISTGKLVEN